MKAPGSTGARRCAGGSDSGVVERGSTCQRICLARDCAGRRPPVSIDLAEPARAGLELATLHKEREISYQGEGWGLCFAAAISS